MSGLYIHIPFCSKKCAYCDFCSIVGDSAIMTKYIDSVIAESQKYAGDIVYDTVFIGGGTPTILPCGELTRLYDGISKNLNIRPTEFTVEGNPNSYSEAKISEYMALGMTRASVGVQSFDDAMLQSLGRVHTANQAEKAIAMLVAAGLDVSCDIMLGLAGQTIDNVIGDIDKSVALGVGHVSCYGLIVEPNTPLFTQVECGKTILPECDYVADMYDAACELLTKRGLPRYEISNFGKPCRHNVGYWMAKPYLGLGASAHSLIGNVRQYNTDNIANYINGEAAIIEEILSSDDIATEKIILGLRTKYGVNLAELKTLASQRHYETIIDTIRQDCDCYDINGDILTLKPQFYYCQNQLLSKF